MEIPVFCNAIHFFKDRNAKEIAINVQNIASQAYNI